MSNALKMTMYGPLENGMVPPNHRRRAEPISRQPYLRRNAPRNSCVALSLAGRVP